MKRLALVGQKFGRWEVKSFAHSNDSKSFWNCLCECGRTGVIQGVSLRRGQSLSCGCLRDGYWKTHPDAHQSLRPFEATFKYLVRAATRRRIPCALTYEEFLEFTTVLSCYYCGDTIQWTRFNAQAGNQRYNLDRRDNELPYSKDNCVVCCPTCNWMKGGMEPAKFVTQVGKIAAQLRIGGLSINSMAQEAWDNAEAHGFHEGGVPPLPESLMLIVSEAAEALEDDRKGLKDLAFDEKGKPTGVGQELADIVIRVGHTAVLHGIDLEAMTIMKQRFNRSRPHKHGKKY
jgi:hypothetical protein